MEFTAVEQALMNWFADHASCPELEAQFRGARPAARNYTGDGSYTDFLIPDNLPRAPVVIAPPGAIIGPDVFAPEIPNGACTQVYCIDGVLKFLEIATYADSFPEQLREFSLKEIG